MIPKYNGSKSEKSTSFAPIPAGGYVAKIMGARIENYSWGSVLIIAFDPEIGRRNDHGNREDREHCEQNSSNHVFFLSTIGLYPRQTPL